MGPPPSPPMTSISSCISVSWRAKTVRVTVQIPLAEAAGDVVLCALVPGVSEDLTGEAVLDKLAGAALAGQQHERRVVRDTGRLLHIVSDDDDREVLDQLTDEVLDPERGDRGAA